MTNFSPSQVSHELEFELDANTVLPDLAHAARTVELARRAERQNLSRELHDTVVQPLTALAAALELLPPLPLSAEAFMAHAQMWKQLVYESLDSLRRSVAGLQTHPHMIQALPDALEMYLVPLFDSRGIHVTVDAENWPDHLPADSAFHLYLTVREAVVNADKHGHASQISIVMRGFSTHLSLVIVDNGTGFRSPSSTHPHASSAGAARSTGTGLGLVSMRERVHLLGGELSISSAPGEGARIEIAVPRSASDVNRSSTTVEALST
jgi:signal transduction histidine kinase